jgi:hypothetical protein
MRKNRPSKISEMQLTRVKLHKPLVTTKTHGSTPKGRIAILPVKEKAVIHGNVMDVIYANHANAVRLRELLDILEAHFTHDTRPASDDAAERLTTVYDYAFETDFILSQELTRLSQLLDTIRKDK